jgi:hypothetical protein
MLEGSHGDGSNASSDGGPQFAEVFVIYWVGAMVVTLNIKLFEKNSDGQQFQQQPLTSNKYNKKTKTYGIGNLSSAL